MKPLAALGLILAISAQAPAFACEPTSDQLVEWHIRSRQLEETYLVELAKDSDQVLTGLVTEVDLLKDGPYVQRAHINVDRMIKGNDASVATALMYKRHDPQRDSPALDRIASCSGPIDPAQEDPYVQKTYRYIFYIKDGVLMRANGFSLGPPPLEPPEEILLLQQRVAGARK